MTIEPISVVSPVSIALSGEWSFSVDKDNSGEKQGWTTPNFNDSSWVSVQVPHTWNVMPEYSEYEGFAWYRRSLSPSGLQNSHVRLKFDAVFYLAHVWLNGRYLGQHEEGTQVLNSILQIPSSGWRERCRCAGG
jgi:beta-galactosidase/beta-glucuronidase